MTQQIPSQIPDEDLDMAHLTRELDKVKSRVFLRRNAAFLGSLMSSLQFIWSYDTPTAGTDGERFYWNPNDFLGLPDTQKGSTVEHELWHIARMHIPRCGTRDPQLWNIACDIRINRDLRKEGHDCPPPLWIQDMPECPHEVEEDIYDWLVANNVQPPPTAPGGQHAMHMVPTAKGSQQKVLNNLVKALHQAKIAGEAGNLPGGIEEKISQFLAPVVPWRTVLYQHFTDLMDYIYTWRRPNRRHQDIYLPSRKEDEGRLEHLMYMTDVSGSIQPGDKIRVNSEVKFIKDTFNPKKMTLVQFDTRITNSVVIEEHQSFDGLEIKGGGGTCLRCVREYIIEHKPTVCIIFTDLEVAPMQPLPFDIPIIWIAVRATGAKVPFGKLIHING